MSLELSPDEQAAAAKIAALGDAAGKLAHDFNNLLAAIAGSASLIEMGGGDTSRHVRNIQAATQRGAKVMRQLLALSSRTDAPLAPTTVAEIFQQVAAEAAQTLGDTHSLSTFAVEDLPAITADRSQIAQTLTSLVENARDAMPEGGSILLTATIKGEADGHAAALALSVHDSGPGIPADLQARVLEPFFTTKPKGKGAGLGLTIALRVLQRHGGRLDIKSEPGAGTVVTCFLPLPAGH